MSDSESECDWRDADLDKHHEIAFLNRACDITIVNPQRPMQSPDDMFEKWDKISHQDKMKCGELMKMCAFWLPILLKRMEGSTATCWAAQVGLVEPYEDLSLRNVQKIEILEAILRALVKGTLKRAQTKQVMWITNRFYTHSPEVLENALQWLERTGEANIRQRVLELGHLDICFKTLHLIFVEFAQYVKAMSLSFEGTMAALTVPPSEKDVRKCEEMKKKGNEQFQLKLYEEAADFYSRALTHRPDNHIVYSNRALCYIKSKKFLKALGDGKRATLIKPLWAKGHYRYCEALYGLGEVRLALEANHWAQSLCEGDADGLRDLESQHIRFTGNVTTAHGSVGGGGLSAQKEAAALQSSKAKETSSAAVTTEPEPRVKVENRAQSANDRTTKASAAAVTTKATTKAARSSQQQKILHKSVQEKVVQNQVSTRPKDQSKKSDVSTELLAAVTDAHSALENHRSRNAEQNFSRALNLVTKAGGVSSIDVLLLQFGRVTALTQIGRPQELSEAMKLLNALYTSEERTFHCLLHLAYGRVYVKENRFKMALTHFLDSLKIVKNQITPGVLTWPLTSHVVPETRLDFLMDVLETSIELCRFPPPPDAVCRMDKCVSALKKHIYFTDPEFKGFIRVSCCLSCSVEYHMSCWKNLKTLSFYEKSEKDFLQDLCLTPDCNGRINSIKIYSPTGLVKCKFEVAIPKPVAVSRPKVNQTCTSLKKIKSKEERRQRRKRHKERTREYQDLPEDHLKGTDQTPPTARLHFRDHMLLQISQHMDLLRGERSWSGTSLRSSLKPWLLLDLSKGGTVASQLLQTLEEPNVSLGDAVELLLERRNRVWARLLIQDLSNCTELQPKLLNWAQRLDSAGLGAAQMFLEQFSSDLELLDLSLLLSFSPVQNFVVERLGTVLLTSLGLTLNEFLRQCPPKDVRLFIWALEEHRQHYSSCHSLLDHYFDMMDGLCSVIKKSEEENNFSSPNKSKHRSKKKKGQKSVLVWAGPHDSPGTDDWGPGLMDDDSLSFLEQPFSVPPHLRQQVAVFEQQYNSSQSRDIEIVPDSSTTTLYEYFAQILAEHGPLPPDDPLLVSELRNFPMTSQRQIEAAGGLQAFLLKGGAFVAVGGCVALAGTETPLSSAPFDSLDQLDAIDGGGSLTLSSAHIFNLIRDTFPSLTSDLYTDHAHSEVELLSVAVNTQEIQEHERYQGELLVQMKTHQEMLLQMVSMTTDTDKLQCQRSRELKELQEELSLASSSAQVTQKELSLFQHKLEEEVKKDQKEKKEHQEQLKGLRQELDALHQQKNRVKKSITDKNSEYEKRLRDFLELSNQSAAERMSLEDELKHCNDRVTRASRRSLSAQVSVMQWSRDLTLFFLHHELADNRAVLCRLGDVAPRFSHQDLEAAQDKFRTSVQDIETKISTTKSQFERLMKDLNDAEVNDLGPEVTEVTRMATPTQPVTSETLAVQATPLTPPPAGGATASVKKKPKKPTETPTVFERAVERLSAIFPHVSRAELSALIQKLRSSSGRSLHSLTLQDVVGGVSQLILDQQEEQERAQASSGNGASAWQPLELQRSAHLDALNSDDPCIICHEDMSPENMCVLECRHGYHTECIRSWLKEQSTCPTCRDHALLPEDFPKLSVSIRRH